MITINKEGYLFLMNFERTWINHIRETLKIAKVKKYIIDEGYYDIDDILYSLWVPENSEWNDVFSIMISISLEIKKIAIEEGYATEESPASDFYLGMNFEEYAKSQANTLK